MPNIDAKREDYGIVTWDLNPGDVYVFHATTVHGAVTLEKLDVLRAADTIYLEVVRKAGVRYIHLDTMAGGRVCLLTF